MAKTGKKKSGKKKHSALSYRALLEEAVQSLYKDFETPRIDAEVLLMHALQEDLSWFIVNADSLASKEHTNEYLELVKQRAQGQPIAYLTGHKEFWSLDLIVNPCVLIPRPDTETLVEQALEVLPINSSANVLDLGTGSGAIALAIAKERPKTSVLAVDSSQAALGVATQNAEKHGLLNVRFLQSDWFQQLGDEQFDLVISNPPYIEPNDAHLQQGDLRFEPSSALQGAGDGLGDIRHIVDESANHLNPGAYLIIEHGYNQATKVHDSLAKCGFNNISNHQDLNKLPRCTTGQWQTK